MASLFNPPRFGPAPAAGDKLYFYQTGTTTPQDTFSQSDLAPGHENTNPVVADSTGLFGPIYLVGTPDYKVILKSAADVTKWTTDPLLSSNAFVIAEEGDLIIGNSLGEQSRLPIGAANTLLKSDGTTADWEQINLSTDVKTDKLPSVNLPTGTIVDRVYAEYLTFTTFTAHIPADDTIPQISEGTELLTATITPKSTSNRVRVRFEASMTSSSIPDQICAALFRNAGVNAIASRFNTQSLGGSMYALEYEDVPGSISAQVYSLRVGGTASNATVNGTSARMGGGTQRATLILEEIVA